VENRQRRRKMERRGFSQLLLFSFLVSLLLLGGACGHKVQHVITPVKPEPIEGEWHRIVILPLADYTGSSTLYEAWRRNVLVSEALQDEFYRYGFMPAPQEEVYTLLMKMGVVKQLQILEPPEITAGSDIILHELKGPWSKTMKDELIDALRHNLALSYEEKSLSLRKRNELIPPEEKFAPLDAKAIDKIGRIFGSRFVVRGRILEFRAGEEETYDPLRRGLLPFFFDLEQRLIFGIARSETYETLQKVSLGAATGTGASYGWATKHWEEGSKFCKYAGRHIGWGALGAYAAYLAHEGGRVPQVVVQIRLIVQDSVTGDVLWANRAEVRTSPETIFAPKEVSILRDKAIMEAAKSLVSDFAAFYKKGLPKIKPIYKEVSLGEEGITVRDITEEVEKAKAYADEAKEAARDARSSAEKAERIFEKMLEK